MGLGMQKNTEEGFNFILIKRILFVCIAVIFLFSIIYFYKIDYFLNMRLPEITPSARAAHIVRSPKQGQYQQFLRKIEQRDIFAPVHKEEIKETAKPKGVNKDKISKMISDLRLVGIIAGEPLKVMIESPKDQKTFYLKKGERFSEGIILERIGENSVILNAYGETFELYL